jgi:hypothetical protein
VMPNRRIAPMTMSAMLPPIVKDRHLPSSRPPPGGRRHERWACRRNDRG